MPRARRLRWASNAVGLAAAGFALAFAWALLRPGDAAPPATPPVAAAPPSPAVAVPLAPAAAEVALTASRTAYLAAVLRAPGPGESSRDVAQARRAVFEREVERLAALGPAAVPLLQAALAAERNDHARLLLLSALSRTPGEAGVQGALDALEALRDPTLEPLFLDRLVRGEDAGSLRLLEAVLRRSPRPETRAALLASAARHGDRRLALLLPELALHDESAAVRMQALATAEEVGAPLQPALLEQMAHADPEPALRQRALASLEASDPQAFLGYARRTLQGGAPDSEQARTLTQALARSPSDEATALLEELASAPDPALRAAAARALRARSARSTGR
jgi:hypothetical protein